MHYARPYLAEYGATTGATFKPFETLFMMVGGRKNSGKSTMLDSCPYLIRFDFDRQAGPNAKGRSTILPGLNRPPLNWDECHKIQTAIIEEKVRNPSKPCVVAFDTVDSMLLMLQSAYLAETNEMRAARKMELVSDFSELDTQKSYGTVYNRMWAFTQKFLANNIGVVWVTHILDQTFTGDDRREYTAPVFSLRGTLRDKVIGHADFMFAVESTQMTKTLLEPRTGADGKPMTDAAGKVMMRPTGTTEQFVSSAVFRSPKQAKYDLKAPPNMPGQISDLTLENGWDTIKEAYEAARKGVKA